MKRLYFIIVTMLLLCSGINAQTDKNYIVVTIEKKSNKGLHKAQTDYWIVDVDAWNSSNDKTIIPLYISNLSATDYDECCVNKDLILFNIAKEESFDYEKGVLESQKQLEQIIQKHKNKVETVKKKWSSGKKERIEVFLTPISGSFCLCTITHKDDNSKIGYDGKIVIPLSNMSYNKNLKEQEYKDIGLFDFSSLPFLSLHTIQ